MTAPCPVCLEGVVTVRVIEVCEGDHEVYRGLNRYLDAELVDQSCECEIDGPYWETLQEAALDQDRWAAADAALEKAGL